MRRSHLILVIALIWIVALGGSLWLSRESFTEDRRVFLHEINSAALRNVNTAIGLEYNRRLEEIRTFATRVIEQTPGVPYKEDRLFGSLPPYIKDEIIALTFFKRMQGKIDAFLQYQNMRVFRGAGLPRETLGQLFQQHPVFIPDFYKSKATWVRNRSIATNGAGASKTFNVITLVLDGSFLKVAPPETVIVVDMSDAFLRRALARSELAETFLIQPNGRVIAHPNPVVMVEFAGRPLNHPVVQSLGRILTNRGSEPLNVQGETRYVAAGTTPLNGVLAVAQVSQGEASSAIKTWLNKGAYLLLVALGATALLLLGALGLKHLQLKLRRLSLRGRRSAAPEVESVGEEGTPEAEDATADEAPTSQEASEAVAEEEAVEAPPVTPPAPAPKAPPAVTARTPKKTPPPAPPTERLPGAEHPDARELLRNAFAEGALYLPSSGHRTAFGGVKEAGSLLCFYSGEIRPTELPKGLARDARQLAEALLEEALSAEVRPGEILSRCNSKFHSVFRGKLFATLVVGTWDLVSGRLELASAGHPPPLRLPAFRGPDTNADKEAKLRVEALVAPGERLGTRPEVGYPSVHYQLEPGDRVVTFTQGTLEARNRDGTPWGTEGIAQAVLEGTHEGQARTVLALAHAALVLESYARDRLPRGDRVLVGVQWLSRHPEVAVEAPESPEPKDLAEVVALSPEGRERYLYDEPSETEQKKAA